MRHYEGTLHFPDLHVWLIPFTADFELVGCALEGPYDVKLSKPYEDFDKYIRSNRYRWARQYLEANYGAKCSKNRRSVEVALRRSCTEVQAGFVYGSTGPGSPVHARARNGRLQSGVPGHKPRAGR